eukprot:gene20152-20059_t
MRQAYMAAFTQDMANIDAGLYLAPQAKTELAQTRKSFAYLQDVRAIDQRRLAKNGVEVRDE